LLWVALPFVLWWAAWLVTVSVIGFGFTFAARILVEAAGTSLPRLIPVLMFLETLVFVGGLLGAYAGGVVHQFLLARLYWNLHPRRRLAEEDIPLDSRVLPTWAKPALGVIGAVLLVVSGFGTWQYIAHVTSEIPVEITAHRGSSRGAPENTLSALRQAMLEGADYAEIDVQSTRDGRVVLLHDGDLMRVAGDPRRVEDLTVEELRELDVGRWFSEEFSGERIATLEEAIDLVRGRLKLNIELKYNRPDPSLGERVVRILRTKNFVSECVITSLTADELLRLGKQTPELRTGLIVTAALGDTTRMPVAFLSMNTTRISHGSVKLAQRQGKAIHVWTVNDRVTALRMIEMGVDNLITDEPEMIGALRQELRELSQPELVALALRTRFLP
jgi:glycerophosphoryl diester phosphodiesterase